MNIYIYGTGLIAKHFSYHLNDEINILGYIETKPKEKIFLNKPIFRLEEINGNYDYIIIASSYANEIISHMKKYGIKTDKIINLWNEDESTSNIDSRLAFTRCCADMINEFDLKGAVAELGVYRGDFAKYISRAFPDRKIYLFDTFEGFSECDVEIDHSIGNYETGIKSGNYCYGDIEKIIKKMYIKQNIVIKKGYFPESAKDINPEERFVFVNIDVDLYQPIYEALNFFWPRMVVGGYILIHDYSSPKWPGVKMAVQKFSKDNSVYYAPIPDFGGSIMLIKSEGDK